MSSESSRVSRSCHRRAAAIFFQLTAARGVACKRGDEDATGYALDAGGTGVAMESRAAKYF
jgi:hypothetical protein